MSRSLLTRLGALPSLLALILTAAPATAQNYYWNQPSGGSGNWDTTSTMWSNTDDVAPNLTWLNDGTATAIFDSGSGTVTLTEAISAAGLSFTSDGYTVTGNTLTLAGAGGPIGVSTGTATINSILAGSAGLTKSGAGTLVLGGANTYTGVTAVNAGVLAITNAAALGAIVAGNNTTVTAGAAVQVSGGITGIAEPITLNGTGISDGGALRNTAGDNTWSGAVSLGSATRINSDAGLLTISGAVNGASAGQDLMIGGAGNVTANGVIGANVGQLIKDGSGTLTLGATNTYTGATNINGGVLSINLSTQIPAGTADVNIDGGTLRSTNAGAGSTFLNVSHAIRVGAGGATLDIPGTNVLTYQGNATTPGGTISGTGAVVTKTGPGTLRLTNATVSPAVHSTVSVAKLVINGGLWQGGSDVTFGAVPGSPLADQITLDTGGGISSNAGFTLNANRGITLGAGGGRIDTQSTLTYGGVITGTGGLTKTGSATAVLILTGASNYTGGTTISAGILQIGNNGSTGNIAGNVTNNATLQFNRTNGITFGGVISGSGAVNQIGSGLLTLTGANTYTGLTRVNNGALAFNSIANVGGGSSALGAPTTAANGTISVGNGVTAATLRYTGSVDVSTNRVINMAGTTGSAFLESSGAGAITYTSNLTVTGAGIKSLNLEGSNTGANTIAGVIPDSAGGATSLVKNEAGTWVLTGSNTYTGTTTVSGTGRLLVNGQAAPNSGTGTGAVTVNSGSTFGGTGRAAGAVTVNGGGRVLGGDGTAANQTLTLGNNLSIGNNGGIQVDARVGSGFNDTTTAGAGLVAVAGIFDQLAAGNVIQLDINLVGGGFDLEGGTTYTRRVLTYGTLGSNLAAGDGTYASGDGVFNVNPIGFTLGSGWQVLVGQDGNVVDVQFTPVPEPATVMAVAAAGLGLGGLVRRLRRRSTALAA